MVLPSHTVLQWIDYGVIISYSVTMDRVWGSLFHTVLQWIEYGGHYFIQCYNG